jgi:LPXTG-site transpeptidase (sortase) family protein
MVLHQPDPGRGRAEVVTTRSESINEDEQAEAVATPSAAEEAGDVAEAASGEAPAEGAAEEQAVEAAAAEAPQPEPQSPSIPAPPPAPPTASAGGSSPIQRLRVSQVGIDANVITLGVDPDGTMQAPSTAFDVAWYDFSARPGNGSNAVFAAHVDFRGVGPAVFWRLRELREGSQIQVVLDDGSTLTYRVVIAQAYGANDAPIEWIVGATERDSITLITCDGTFNTATREYDRRLVVRAERSDG